MKLALHTFKKDARHLWPAIAISLALLAMLARADRWRFDSLIGSTEGWLNLLLPMAWACLVALSVLEEPLAGDRHFWLTRPHRWPTLLAAKLIFAVAFVHLPSLLADSYILIAHGFSPLANLPQLLLKQAMLAAAITLPAIALAALSGNFTHFMMMLFAVAAGAVFATGGPFRMLPSLQRPEDYLRNDVVATLVAIFAIVIIGLQFRRRKLAIARTVALLGALLTGGLYAYVPESFDNRMRAALHPGHPITLKIGQAKNELPGYMLPGTRDSVAIPLEITGLPSNPLYHAGQVELTITTANGVSYRNTVVTPDSQFAKIAYYAQLRRFPYDLDTAPLLLVMQFERAVYAQIKSQPVRITGRLPVSFYRLGETASMPSRGQVAVPGAGRCTNALTDDRWSEPGSLKVLCESTSLLPKLTRVTMSIPQLARDWHHSLGDMGNIMNGPRWAWLSPLDRGKTFFNISDPRTRIYTISMEVPLEHLDEGKIAITPEIPTGYTVVDFSFPDITLTNYVAKPTPRRY